MYGNDMLDAQGRVKVNEKHHEIVMLEKMLNYSRIPHFFDKHGTWKIHYPSDPIGGGCVFTVWQLEEGSSEDLVRFMDNETDEIKDVPIMQAYESILCHHIIKELDK